MDENLHTDDVFKSHSTGNRRGSMPYAGAFFPSSRNLVVEGGVFTSNVITNVTHNHHTYPPTHEFRKIPMGEIDLQHEIRLDHDSSIVYGRRVQRSARRMYSARVQVDGCKSAMTVAWYQGPNAEQKWRQDISIHSWLRHPNFVQLYGVASTGSMHAAVFHNDLIPVEEFVDIYRNSPILSLYFRAYWAEEFREVNDYLHSMFNRAVSENKCTLWIRGSNRRLCVNDVILNDNYPWGCSYLRGVHYWRPAREEVDIMSYNGPNHEAVVISSLALSHYHEFCGHYRSRSRSFFLPAHATTTVGMVVRHHPSSCEVESPVNIAFMPLLDVVVLNTSWSWASGADSSCGSDVWPGGLPGTLMSDSWRRYRFDQISAVTSITRYLYFNYLDLWLGQANHIFSSLHITSTHDQYAVVDRVRFTCIFTPTTRPSCPSQGWLFVCPDAQLRSGPCSFRWPDCAAYWSRDPFGAVRLSTEEAEEAGFPLIKLQLRVSGKYWDDTDYARLWQFHQAKGFVPNSQEIAQHLGHPLYQLCDELRVEAPFAHVTGEGKEEDNASQHDTANTSAMSEEDGHETVASEHGDEDGKPGGIQANILLLSTGSKLLFKLPTAILVLVVLCCLADTAY